MVLLEKSGVLPAHLVKEDPYVLHLSTRSVSTEYADVGKADRRYYPGWGLGDCKGRLGMGSFNKKSGDEEDHRRF